MKKSSFLIMFLCFTFFTSQKVFANELIRSVVNGDIQTAIQLLENGTDVNFKDKNGNTAIMLISSEKQLELVKLLIKNGAHINLQNKFGWTALMYTSIEGLSEITKVLLENGANVNTVKKDGVTALIGACNNYGFSSVKDKKLLEIIKLLLENGADIEIKDNRGKTALDYAIGKRSLQLIDILRNSKNKEIANNQNNKEISKNEPETSSEIISETALMKAVRENNFNMVKILVENGIDISIKNKDGYTALTIAAENGFTEIVKFLIQNGAR